MNPADLVTSGWLQFIEFMDTGGPVMWPLLTISVVMWILIVERVLFIGRLYRRPIPFSRALRYINENTPPGQVSERSAVALLVRRFLEKRSSNKAFDRHILDETVASLTNSLSGRLAVIGIMVAIAPLLGLLGTVTGMITTFDVLAIFGTGNSKAMAGGISEALITTQTGLLVAIPGLYMKAFLEKRARNLNKRIVSAGLYLRRYL